VRMPGVSAEPAAFLIRSDEDFGHIRMHNLWSEALGLRNEKDTFITVEMEQALSWLASKTNQPDLERDMLRHLRQTP
jgi:hypothetical protein